MVIGYLGWNIFMFNSLGLLPGLFCQSSTCPSVPRQRNDQNYFQRVKVLNYHVHPVVVAIMYSSYIVWRHRSWQALSHSGLLHPKVACKVHGQPVAIDDLEVPDTDEWGLVLHSPDSTNPWIQCLCIAFLIEHKCTMSPSEFTIFALLCTYCWSVSPKQALSWSSLSQSYTSWPRPLQRQPLIPLWIHWKYPEQLNCDSNEEKPLITLDWRLWMASTHGMKLSDLYPREGRDMKILKKSYCLKILII